LKDLLQASYQAGYKMSVNSPEGMLGVEGLTHDHLVEISAGVYMKFKHSYAVGQVSDKAVELLDPHGNQEASKQQIYNSTVKEKIRLLVDSLEELKKELKKDNYSSFSLETKNQLDTVFVDLEEYRKGKTALHTLLKKWSYLKNRRDLVETDGKLTGLRSKIGKNVLEELMNNKTILEEEDIGKGFVVNVREVSLNQFLSYDTLLNNMESIRINKLK
jgi:hypothetical protein